MSDLSIRPATPADYPAIAALTLAAYRAYALGCTAVVLYVRDFTVAAQCLYQRHGFTRTPDQDWSPLPGVKLLAMRREQQWTT